MLFVINWFIPRFTRNGNQQEFSHHPSMSLWMTTISSSLTSHNLPFSHSDQRRAKKMNKKSRMHFQARFANWTVLTNKSLTEAQNSLSQMHRIFVVMTASFINQLKLQWISHVRSSGVVVTWSIIKLMCWLAYSSTWKVNLKWTKPWNFQPWYTVVYIF